jgi:hypothetical protein
MQPPHLMVVLSRLPELTQRRKEVVPAPFNISVKTAEMSAIRAS